MTKKDVAKTHVATVWYLAPFSSAQIQEFANKWYEQHESDPKLAPARAIGFVNAVNENSGTKRLARVPYLVTLMALIHRKATRLPHGRTDLYDRIATAYLESIDVTRDLDQLPYSLPQKKRWLAEVGFQMQLRRTTEQRSARAKSADILATTAEVSRWLSKAMNESGGEDPDEEAKVVLDYFASRSGLLVPRGEGLFAFMHLSLQEYFTACYLEPRLTSSRFAKTRKSAPSDRELRRWANQNEWLEAFVLLFEELARKNASDTEEFFDFLFNARFKYDARDGQGIAARLLAEIVTDPFVVMSANTRRRGRNMAWRWAFQNAFEPDEIGRAGDNTTAIAPLLLAEFKGDLRAAWDAAGFSAKDLRECPPTLSLAGCTGMVDLRPLSALTQLRSLSLSGCGKIVDLLPLSKLRRLKSLGLEQCAEVSDLGPLGSLKQLEILDLAGCERVANLSPISGLTKIERLHLATCGSFDALRPLSSLRSLKSIAIDRVTVPINFAHLERCDVLQELLIEVSLSPQDVSPLARLKALAMLHLHHTQTEVDFTPFVKSNIRHICLAGSEPKKPPQELVDRGVFDSGPATVRRRKARVTKST